jgi:hypothetical protein
MTATGSDKILEKATVRRGLKQGVPFSEVCRVVDGMTPKHFKYFKSLPTVRRWKIIHAVLKR